jgi:hypothetical protein
LTDGNGKRTVCSFMPSKGQQMGMRGVFLVAAELVARGFVVSPTSRNAMGADLFVTDAGCVNARSVQVKTNAKPSPFWLVGQKAEHLVSRSHIYVLVNIRQGASEHEYFIVPSKVLAPSVRVEHRKNSIWYAVYKRDIGEYRDLWGIFGRCDEP